MAVLQPLDALGAAFPAEAAEALQVLEQAGHEAWAVGGWVRDSLLGVPCHDVDVATSARWPQTAEAFERAGWAVHPTGTAHGTVTVVRRGVPLEVTTYRTDGPYTDGRHPDSVAFVDSVEKDLARRDLTVNAMAWHPARGLRDPFGGAHDLEAGLVRAVGDPRLRMEEDALRVLRAVRFSARLGARIEPATQAALDAAAPLLAQVSQERIGQEMRGLLAAGRGGQALRSQRRAIFAAVPELGAMDGFPQATPYHCMDVLCHVARVMDYVPVFAGGVVSEHLAWAALLHDVGKPDTLTVGPDGHAHFYGHPSRSRQIAAQVLRRQAVPSEVTVPALALVRYHDRPVTADRASVLRILGNLDQAAPGRARPLFFELMALKRADAVAKAPAYRSYACELDAVEAVGARLLAEGPALRVSDLAVGGADVMAALGLAPGPAVGAALRALLGRVRDGEVPNRRDDLLAALQVEG